MLRSISPPPIRTNCRGSAVFLLLDYSDNEEHPRADAFCTWSDLRRNQPNRSPEYHLYYSADLRAVEDRVRAGNLLVIAQKPDRSQLTYKRRLSRRRPINSRKKGERTLRMNGPDLGAGLDGDNLAAADIESGLDRLSVKYPARS